MPVIINPEESNKNLAKPSKKIVVLMKKIIDIDSPEYTAYIKEIKDLYAKGAFDELLILRDDEETYFKLFENEYVVATLKDMDYIKQKLNTLTRLFSDHKAVVDKTLDYLKGEMFNLKGKVYYLEEETSKQKAILDELKNVTKTLLDFVKKIVETRQQSKYIELKAKIDNPKTNQTK